MGRTTKPDGEPRAARGATSAAPQHPGYTPSSSPGTGPAHYDVHELPDRENGSKLDMPVTMAGWSMKPGEVLAQNAWELVKALTGKQTPVKPPSVEVQLQEVRRTRGGEYVLRPRGTMKGTRTHDSTRPGQRWRRMESSTQGFDSFLSRGEAYEKMPDGEAWACLLATCERHQLQGRPLRSVCDAFAVAICLRAGISVNSDSLPQGPR